MVEVTLEQFEKKRRGGGLHRGKYARFLMDLEELIPTVYPLGDTRISAAQIALVSQWNGRSGLTGVKGLRGGEVRTAIIDDELYVVWYPKGKVPE